MKAVAVFLAISILGVAILGVRTLNMNDTPSTVFDIKKTEPLGEQKPVPLFKAITIDNENLSIPLQGKITIVNFWASWCAPCIEELPSMIQFSKIYKNDVLVVAVSADKSMKELRQALKAFPQLDPSQFKVVLDLEGHLKDSYEVTGIPESFIISPEQKLLQRMIGTVRWDSSQMTNFMDSILKQ